MIKPYKSSWLNYIVGFLVVAIIFLIPYDSIRFMPSSYRPLSIIPLILLFFIMVPAIIRKKIDGATQYLIAFYCVTNLLSFLLSFSYGEGYEGSIDYLLTTSIIIVILCFCFGGRVIK